MDVDRILTTLNDCQVDYLLIGGINFLIRHRPVATFDVDVWIDDSFENCRRCEQALTGLDAAWGATDADWQSVRQYPPGWLQRQSVFAFASPYGAIDVFRSVLGLASWSQSHARSLRATTAGGVSFHGLCDEDMLACQLAIPLAERKLDRVRTLELAIRRRDVTP